MGSQEERKPQKTTFRPSFGVSPCRTEGRRASMGEAPQPVWGLLPDSHPRLQTPGETHWSAKGLAHCPPRGNPEPPLPACPTPHLAGSAAPRGGKAEAKSGGGEGDLVPAQSPAQLGGPWASVAIAGGGERSPGMAGSWLTCGHLRNRGDTRRHITLHIGPCERPPRPLMQSHPQQLPAPICSRLSLRHPLTQNQWWRQRCWGARSGYCPSQEQRCKPRPSVPSLGKQMVPQQLARSQAPRFQAPPTHTPLAQMRRQIGRG